MSSTGSARRVALVVLDAGVGFAVVPLDEEIAVVAAALRALRPSVRLPDALVVATGESLEADIILTTDRRLARLPRFQLVR